MIHSYTDMFLGLFLGLLIGVILILVTAEMQKNAYRKTAIENGAASYNQTTGKFEWKIKSP